MLSSPYYSAGGTGPVVVQGHAVTGTVPVSTYNHSNAHDYYHAADHDTKQEHPVSSRRCNDALFALLFYAHLGAIAWLTAVYLPQMYSSIASQYGGRRFLQEEDNSVEFPLSVQQVLLILGISGVVSVIVSSAALAFMVWCAAALIKVALWWNIVANAVTAIAALATGAMPLAIMMALAVVFSAYYAYVVWNRIPFAAANLVTALTAVRANLGVAFFAYLSLILQLAWTLWWSVALTATLYVTNGCNAQGECETTPQGGIVFLFLVSYFWTHQVLKNTVHVTVAGVVGTWWFAPIEAQACCSRAIGDSWIRSMTTSFGSICLGSLLVAIIQALREMVKQMRDQDDSILACCAECILGCIESLVEYFNQWAFVYVGLYGMNFIEAGKSVITLFKSRGWTTIISDMLVDSVLTLVAVGVGVLTGLVGLVVASNSSEGMVGAFLLGFLVGLTLAATLFSVVSSAVHTVIVCYAEAPAEFQQNHVQLSEEMRAAWRQAWPNDFHY